MFPAPSSPAPDAGTLAGQLAARLPFFYGWVIIAICFLSFFMMGAVSYWGIPLFVVPMSDDTGWSHSSIFLGLGVRMVVGAGCGLLLGHIADRRWGAARLMLVGVVIDAGSLIALRWVDSALQFILLYGVVGGVGSTGMRLLQATLLAKWYVAKRGMAVGFAANGGGVSALIMVPIIAILIDLLGWRDAWATVGILLVVVLIPLAPFAVRAPEDIGLLPDNGEQPSRAGVSADSEYSYRLSEVLHTWQFWLLMLAALFGMYSLQTQTIIMIPYFEEIGFTSGQAAASLALYGAVSIALRFAWGWSADRFTVRRSIIGQAVLTAIGCLLLMPISGVVSLYLVMAYLGIALSGYPPLQILLWPEFFGRAHIGSIVGATQFVIALAGAIGPVIAGIVYDETGSYIWTLWLLVGTWLATAVLMLIVRPARDASRRAPVPA